MGLHLVCLLCLFLPAGQYIGVMLQIYSILICSRMYAGYANPWYRHITHNLWQDHYDYCLQCSVQGTYYFEEPVSTTITSENTRYLPQVLSVPWLWLAYEGANMQRSLPISGVTRCTGVLGESCLPGVVVVNNISGELSSRQSRLKYYTWI